jgi:hypothetical protein
MNTIPNTTRLTTLEILLKKQLENSGLFPVPLVVNCFLEEGLIILVELPDNYFSNMEKIESYVYQVLDSENLSQAYFVEIYYYINNKFCSLELETKPNLVERLSLLIFNEDQKLFFNKYIKLAVSFSHKNCEKLINNFKSNKLSWLVFGGSLGSLIILVSIYGLTRPCIFDQCPQISQAENLSNQAYLLLNDLDSDEDLIQVKTNLKEAVSLVQNIPAWSKYHQEASTLNNKYNQSLSDLLLFILAKEKEKKALLLADNKDLSVKNLEEIAQTWEEASDFLANIQDKNSFKEIIAMDQKKYKIILENIKHRITVEKQAEISIKLAKKAAILATKREETATKISELQLVYATWKTAIERLQELPATTTSYKSSRELLKKYVSNKIRAEKRLRQEEIAINLFKQAKNEAKIAQKYEEENQWFQAVSHWNNAIVYIKKIPDNTYEWNKGQPFISTYSLSLSQANNKLKEITESQKIVSELDAMCWTTEKICRYEIKEKLIQMKLDSRYLEQLWSIALQAKAQANIQVQVELLNHLSTFEHRLQKISNQTGKSIEVYNAQGNLMTVYHRQQ